MIIRKFVQIGVLILFAGLLLVSCKTADTAAPTATMTETIPPENTPIPATPTAIPRTLTICIGQEPTTLYQYGGSERSMWSVLEAIYDGPFDTRSFETQPVILEKLPSFESGDVSYQPVEVSAGSTIVNAEGELVPLTNGTLVFPAGCHSTDCAVQWDGVSPLQMDQMVVRFKLLPGITWSDGTPLTAKDSVFSYELAADNDTPVSKYSIYRTQSYQMVDDLSVEWVGKPGFLPQRYETYFWSPLPEHQLSGMEPSELLTDPVSTRQPLGWGPYVIQDWIAGEKITLQKNPNYFRASEDLPKFDNIQYLFTGIHADNQIAGVLEGKCDVVDDTTDLVEQLEPIIEESRKEKLDYYIGQGPEFEQVSFGIKPASYDDGYNPYAGERADFFSDVRVRKAFAYCMNRAWAVTDILIDESIVPASFLPPTHPLFLSDLEAIPFDIEEGKRLLDEAGWRDIDNDPATPRQAWGVPNVLDGTPFVITYATTFATQRLEVAKILVDSLNQCGIQANLQSYNPGELFSPGPEGLVFGRNFDLAHFSWENGPTPSCSTLVTNQIPAKENDWMGVNVIGYSNPDLDKLCQTASQTRLEDTSQYNAVYTDLQRMIAEDLPFIPLYFRLKMAMSRPDFCGMEMDVTTRSTLWNIENFDYGTNCTE
jgi:peptide/nickel transport system substrate-binding protein